MQPGAFYAPPPGMMVVSTNYVPGFRIVRTIGFTWGLIVRARGIGQTPRVRLSACVVASPRSGPCCPQRHHAPREPLPQRPDRPRAKPAPLWFRRGPEPPEEYEEPYDAGLPEEVFEPEYYPEDDFPNRSSILETSTPMSPCQTNLRMTSRLTSREMKNRRMSNPLTTIRHRVPMGSYEA